MWDNLLSDSFSGAGRAVYDDVLFPGMESITLFILKIWSLSVSRETL